MSENWTKDINEMHAKFGVHEAVNKMDSETLKTFLKFRIDFLLEELTETQTAFNEKDPEEIVDGLIDLCVVAIGTLDIFEVNGVEAWDNVYNANMAKEPGIKEGRPNPLGLPDMLKPEGWTAPSHQSNHGILGAAFED